MTRSTFEQPLPATFDQNAARAHSREGKAMGAKWHVYPEMAAAGLWTTPSDPARFLIGVERSASGHSNRVLSRALAREMLSPVGVTDYAVGFAITKIGRGGVVASELSRRIQLAYEWDSFAEPAPRGYRPPVARDEP